MKKVNHHWINTTHQIRTPKCNVTLDISNKDMHCKIEAAAAATTSSVTYVTDQTHWFQMSLCSKHIPSALVFYNMQGEKPLQLWGWEYATRMAAHKRSNKDFTKY